MISKKTKIHEFRKKLIIKAAREVFAKTGFTGATIEEISAHAEVARATLYKFFTTKEELYLAVVEDAFDEIAKLTRDTMLATISTRDKFELFVTRLLNHFSENAGFFGLLMQQFGAIKLDEQSKLKLHERHRELDLLLTQELDRGIQDGSIKPVDSVKAVQVFNHMVYGYQMANLMSKASSSSRVDEVNLLMEIFFNGISLKE